MKPGFGRLASFAEARAVLDSLSLEPKSEPVPIDSLLGRVLAEDVVSSIDVPHFRKASMDGYAVMSEDTLGASDGSVKTFRIAGNVDMGRAPQIEVGPGSCAEIGTGAPLPPGADAVVMVEVTEPAGSGEVAIRKPVHPGENVIEVGSDIRAGSVVLKSGTVLEPRHIGVIAAIGAGEASVFTRPKVALISTGPELTPVGGTIAAGRIFDINTHTLKQACKADGCSVIEMPIAADDRATLKEAVVEATRVADVVLVSGGSSLGGGDLVGETFAAIGEVLIQGVAVKPGKPLIIAKVVARASDPRMVLIGLPGYPMSALSDYYIFLSPFLRRAGGLPATTRTVSATLARKHPSTVGRYEFLPVTLDGTEAHPLTKSSSAITPLAQADGFIEIEENTEVLEMGATVTVRLF